MANFEVKYEIDVDAENAEDAALQVEQILNNMAYRPYLSVRCPDNRVVGIDLEKMPCQPEN